MKYLLGFLLSVLASAWLLWSGVTAGAPVFLREVLSLHGSTVTGRDLAVEAALVDWRERRVSWNALQLAGDVATSPALIRVAGVEAWLPEAVMPAWSAAGLLPSPLPVRSLVVNGIELSYDIDREQAAVLNEESSAVGFSAVSNAMVLSRDASLRAEAEHALFAVDQLQLNGIVVHATSLSDPSRSRNFVVGDMAFSLPGGGGQNGSTAAVIAHDVSRALFAEVQRQALLQGVIEKPQVFERTEERRRSPQRAEENEASAVGEQEDSKVKRAAKSVGQGARDLGRGIKKGFKDLFN